MKKYLIIEKINNGYKIKDLITNNKITYLGYNLRDAIRRHRQLYGLKYIHFQRVYI